MRDLTKMIADATRQLVATRRQSGVGITRQAAEIAQLRRATGMSRAEYFLYRLWRRELPLAAKLEFLSHRECHGLEMRMNPSPYRAMMRSKTLQAERFAAAGLRVPECLALAGIGEPPVALDLPRITTRKAFGDLLAAAPLGGVVIKPDSGTNGTDIWVAAAASADELTTIGGARIPLDHVWQGIVADPRRIYRIERRIQAHPVVAALRPGAVPTVRMLTLLIEGVPVIHAASIKVPLGDAGTDNLCQGNLAAPVVLDSGEVGVAVDAAVRRRLQRHPETDEPITGQIVPDWEECRRTVMMGARALAPMTAFGWDIAIGRDGPVVLEANTNWSEDLVQLPQDRGLVHGPFIRFLESIGRSDLLRHRSSRV